MSDELLPDPVAAMDQALSGIAGTARLMWVYFKSLTDSGFTREEALALTRDYQNVTIQAGRAAVARRAQE